MNCTVPSESTAIFHFIDQFDVNNIEFSFTAGYCTSVRVHILQLAVQWIHRKVYSALWKVVLCITRSMWNDGAKSLCCSLCQRRTCYTNSFSTQHFNQPTEYQHTKRPTEYRPTSAYRGNNNLCLELSSISNPYSLCLHWGQPR